MVKHDILTPEKLRIDGRRPGEVRPIECESGGLVSGSDGSASVSMGLTKAIAYVYGPRPIGRRAQQNAGDAAIYVEYRTATFSAIDRKRRSKGDRQSQERGLWLEGIFKDAILVDQYPKSQIEIFVEILQQDGSPVSAAINAITLALVNAGIPMRDLVASCTLGVMDNKTILVDLNNSEAETGSGAAQICLATYPRTGRISLCEVEAKIPVGAFEEALKLGVSSCSDVAQQMRTHIAHYAESRVAYMQSFVSI
jgi:exosome complex component RRP41